MMFFFPTIDYYFSLIPYLILEKMFGALFFDDLEAPDTLDIEIFIISLKIIRNTSI